MSASVEHIPTAPKAIKRKRMPTALKILAMLMVPIISTIVSLYVYGMHIHNAAQIYPNISIEGIDISGHTRHEAMQLLGLPAYEERSASASVTFVFPDYSELVITGNDAMLQHNAHDVISRAYSIGRGRGIIPDVIEYILRYDAEEISLDISYHLDAEAKTLFSIVEEFVSEYNSRLDASVPRIYDDRIVFTKGAGHVNADVEEIFMLAYLGIFESLEDGTPVEIILSLPETTKFAIEILELRNTIFVEMLSSEFDSETNTATECAVGVDFNAVEAAKLVRDTQPGKTATFYLEFTHPEYTQEYLDSLLFRDLLGQRTTRVGGTANRVGNVELSSEAIHGLVLLPGEEFSFNETVGPRTRERGYRSAPIIRSGEFVPGIGGGICQTSSTIFAAVKPTELLVTERRPHGLPITYLPRGWDATVAWGHIDFRFVNNTDYPLRIDIELEGRELTAQIWGTIIDDFPRQADWND